MKASDFLRQAAEVIEQRGQIRDKPDGERSMERAVDAYVTLNGPVMQTELDGWVFMLVLKLARATAGKPHLDDYQDLCGYGALAAECLERETANVPSSGDVFEDLDVPSPAATVMLKKKAPWEAPENVADEVLRKLKQGQFIYWHGGKNPAPSHRVDIMFRGGGTEQAVVSDHYHWGHDENFTPSSDIIGYKIRLPGDDKTYATYEDAVVGKPIKPEDKWIPWQGPFYSQVDLSRYLGPIHAKYRKVTVRFRNGTEETGPAKDWRWSQGYGSDEPNDYDIVAYKEVE
jgi:hypothetical protein